MFKNLTRHPSQGPTATPRFAHRIDHALANAPCFLGIDGGGTKTHAVITTSAYKIIGEGFSGAANPVRVGFDSAVVHVSEAVKQACAQAGMTLHDITAGCAAIAGISHPIHYHTMKKALDARLRMDHLELVIASAKDLPSVIYNNDAESTQIASLARLVADAAAEGDAVARGILAQAGRDLGELAASVIHKLGLESKTFRVAYVGSVFNAGDCVLEPLRAAVLKVAPRAEVGPPLQSPEIGAVKLARAAMES